MKNFSKILCVVLALVMALSVASCSFSQQYAYQKDDVELPIGVYIYYLLNAYNSAQTYAQQSDLYDSDTGKYDGSKSFLKIEITDDDGNTAIAEDWIKNKAEETTKEAIATYTKFNELGCTLDEAELESAKTYYQSYWDEYYGEQYESYGISFDSFFMAGYTLNVMSSDAFLAQYGTDGPSAVSDEELTEYFTENYTSFKYFAVNLYTTTEAESDDEEDTTVAMSDEEIAAYQSDFNDYVTTLNDGGSFDDVLATYMDKNSITDDPSTTGVQIIDEDTTDEILQSIKDMEDGSAMTVTIGDDATSMQMYLLYREPIENQVAAYITDDESNRNSVLSSMKSDEFDELLESMIDELGITLDSACNGYSPSKFEA